MRRIIVLAVFTLPLMFLWVPFKNINKRVDVFWFVEVEEMPKWIAHDAAWLITNLVLTFSLHLCVKRSSYYYSRITLVLLCFAIFRVVEYFTFKHTLPMLPIVGGIMLYSLMSVFYNKR